MHKTPQTFILTDSSNLFHRQINMTDAKYGIESQIGMALHLILNSMKKEWSTFNGTHLVTFLEGRSWRYKYYPEYKADRKIKFALKSEEEQENHQLILEAFNDLIDLLDTKTNISVLRAPNAEADDMIAVWIEAHPDDNHILISSDSDFFQLLKYGNVVIYDPVKDIRIKQDGIFNDKGQRLEFSINTNAKIKVGKPNKDYIPEKEWYNYALFLKCVRGDKTDFIFSAYPGVREKGSSKTIGIREAYEDRNTKGYNWSNFMMQRWVDHNNEEQQVKTAFEKNCKLIDLSKIPDEIKLECLEAIAERTQKEDVPALKIGTSFMKFCGKWELKKIGDNSEAFMVMLKSKYNK